MAVSREDVTVRLGVDTSSISSGLATARQKFSEFGNDLRRSFTKISEELGGAILAGGIVAGVEKVLSKFDEIKKRSENLGTGTDFLQGLMQISRQDAVGGVETFNRSIGELSVRLGEAKDGGADAQKVFEKWGITIRDIAGLNTEDIFYKIADRIRDIPDPAVQSAAAFELMGKSGKNLVGVLKNGSEEIRKMVDGVNKLDAEKIRILADAKAQLEGGGNTIGVFFGSLISKWGEFWGKVGEITAGNFSGAAAGGAFVKIAEERKALQAKFDAEENAVSAATLAKRKAGEREIGDLTKKANDLDKEYAEDSLSLWQKIKREQEVVVFNRKLLPMLDKDSLDYARLRLQLLKDEHELTKNIAAQKEVDYARTAENQRVGRQFMEEEKRAQERSARVGQLTSGLGGEFIPTLDELAKSGFWSGGGSHGRRRFIQGPYAQDAQELMGLQSDATSSLALGNTDRFNSDRARIQTLRDRLTKAGVYTDPNKSIVDEIAKLQREGMPVEVKMK